MKHMKLRKEFIIHNSGSESLLVPAGNAGWAGLVRGNRTLGTILKLLEQDTTEAEIITAMKQRYDAPEEVITEDVRKALSKLREIGALEE